MEKSEGGDFPANKVKSEPVVNFPANFPVLGRSPAAGVMSVPEQNQPVVPKFVPVKLTPVRRSQLQSPPHLKQTAAPRPLTHPSIQPLKVESPRAGPRQTPSEVKDVTPNRQKRCSCKNSLCLKLYCECFASGIFCDGCKCSNCHNNVENEPARLKAVEATLERKPHAFRPKIASSVHGARDNKEETGDGLVLAKHNRGCHCKKSGCLKKYCECFQANILCSENCKCMDCKNFEGSEERQALFHGDHANNTAYLQQGANAPITGAIGSSGYGSPPFNKKRKGQELFFGSTSKDPIHRNGQLQEEADVESCEQSSSISLKPAKRKTFVAWDSFVRLKPDISSKGEFKVQCTICKEDFIMTPTFETANLKHHLENKHSLNKAKEGQNEPIDQNTYREKMSLAICRHNYAFSFVEHKGIRDIHSYLNPIAKHISRNTAKLDILNLYAREKELLKAELALISSRVCLTSDIWTSLAYNGYMCVTAHYVDLNWVLQKRVLIFRHMSPPHSGAVLGPLLIDFLKEWGIEKKIFTLTLDNATSNNGVVDNLKNHLSLMRSLVCEGKFLHVRCGNHILNLIVKAGLEIADVAIGKIREGVKYIKNSEARLERFAECISNLGVPCSKKLRQDMPIRWNSTYQMIESALLYQQAYIHYDLVDPDFTHGLSEDEWKRVKIVATFLKPFYDISTLFSGCKYPTANLYLPNVCRIKMLLEEHKNSEDSVMREMAIPMLRKFKKYWQSYSVILSVAMVLDPRYKLNFVKFFFSKLNSDTADKKVKFIKKNLQLLFKEYLIPSTTASVTASLPKEHACGSSNDMTVAFEEFDVFESQLESNTAKTQLDLYLEEANLDRKTNPNLDVLGFWKDNRLRYPELSLMARDILSVPITTVAAKSAFSTGGHVIGEFQTSILPANAEAKVCTRDWICGQEDFDGFDSDSDEDEIAVDLQPYLEKHRGHCTSNTQSTIVEATESL